jgi:hypothetical protein
MSRPKTSDVSALSSLVANGHQAVHGVSFSPSEIPYGGFSPVRLQIGIRPRPSLPAHTRRRLIRGQESGRPSLTFSPVRGNRRTESALERQPCGRFRSRGPWLARGLFCPAGSSLTMASSEALVSSRRLMVFGGGSLPCRVASAAAGNQRSPNLTCASFAPCRLPYPGGSGGRDCCSSTRGGLHPFVRGSAPAMPTQKSVHAWRAYEAAEFALCCTPELCRPSTDRGLLHPSYHSASRLAGTSGMTTRRVSQLPRTDFHRQDTQLYGLRHESHEWARIGIA